MMNEKDLLLILDGELTSARKDLSTTENLQERRFLEGFIRGLELAVQKIYEVKG